MPEKPTIEISLLDHRDINLVTEFYNSVHHRGRDENKFKWEFINSPYQSAIYVVAKDKQTGKIVGTQSAIPLELINGKRETTLTAKSEDTLVHQDYRGMDIFNKMYALLFSECEKRKIKIIWGFTTAKKPFTKLGFQTPYSISQCVMVFGLFSSVKYLLKYNPKKGAWSAFKTLSLCVLSKTKTIKKLFVKNQVPGLEYNLVDHTSFDNGPLITDLLSENKERFIIKQDSAYLRWRITENPYHEEYFGINFTIGTLVVANLMFNHHKDGVWYLIQDIYSIDLSKKQKAILLKKAIAILKKNKSVNLIRTWDFTHNKINNEYILIKEKNGFVHLNKGSLFVWKYLDKTLSIKSENFILSRIASEGTI